MVNKAKTATAAGALTRAHVVAIVFLLIVGLAADVRTDLPGQTAIGVAVWAYLLFLLRRFGADARRALFACLVLATAGELVLSLVWQVYTYRLDNVPLFVPPGHVLLLLLALAMSERMPLRFADVILGSAVMYAVVAGIAGIDTLALPLAVVIAAIAVAMPANRPLYASTFVLALALELYGTWLGSWTWETGVPLLPLVTTNPPALASAFYAMLDALVVCTGFLLARGLKPALAR